MLKLLEHVTTPEDIDHNEGLEAVALHAHVGSHGIASDPLVQFTVVFSGLIHDVSCGDIFQPTRTSL